MSAQPADIEPVNIGSVECTCCRHRWNVAPRFPESYICPICVDWLRSFEPPDGIPGRAVHGPVRSIRKLLAGQPLSVEYIANDQSALTYVNTRGRDAIRWQQILEGCDDC